MIRISIAALVACAIAASCGGVVESDVESEDIGDVEQEAKSCPTTLTCPSSIPGYPIFMYSSNNCAGTISCIYRNASNQIGSKLLTAPSGCTNCCMGFYCPNPRCGQITYGAGWTCSN